MMLINGRASGICVLLAVGMTCCSLSSEAWGAALPLDQCKWRLWCDRDAEWQRDRLYLPDEFKLSELAVNPPTIGWERLYQSGIEVTLPSTVEEHFWGRFGTRDYTRGEYYFAKDDNQVKNGNYLGVSWWWTRFKAPRDISGRLAFLKFDGIRQRAEVLLNEQLVGYDLIAETPFTIDVTGKVKSGADNVLAVRITNPGGRLDWPDTVPIEWGDFRIPGGHGFGGINKGVRLEFKPLVYIDSVFVMNRPDPQHITVRCELVNTTQQVLNALLVVSIPQAQFRHSKSVIIGRGGGTSVDVGLRIPNAQVWTVNEPRLYVCRTELRAGDWTDASETRFGFRSFEVRGVGDDAKWYLNRKRIVLRSAISWGFWGINGLWPDEAMARREIINAKKIGLNCLNFHRCIGRPLTLDLQDRLGLLRYEEPGGGGTILSGNAFVAKYMEHKILRMVKRDRSHPSVVMYCLQNEWDPDINHPRLREIMEKMRALDPTRPIVAKSGIGVGNQAFFLPYDERMYRDDGTGYSGWWDHHTVGGPGMYVDNLYQGPDSWSHRSDNRKEIVFWGEMLGAGVPDHLQVVHDYYRRTGRGGYDRDDNAEQYLAFDRFLDKRGFRGAFPTVAALTRSIGNKAYYFWGRMIENIRISDCNDGMVLSGWESTSIENHSGLVDSHRYLKGDPALTAYYCRPLHLAVKSRHLVIETGETLTTDVHVVNEIGAAGDAELRLVVSDPRGRVVERREMAVAMTGGDVFGELLAAGVETDCYAKPGYYTLKASLRQRGRSLVEGRERIFVVDRMPPPANATGAIRDYGGATSQFLAERGIRLPDYWDDLGRLDYIIVAGESGAGVHGSTQRTDSAIENTADPVLYQTQVEGAKDDFWAVVTDIPNGRYQVTLKFAELVHDAPGQRVFDLAINGRTVVEDFDILKEAGGRYRALDRAFDVEVTDHRIRITSPRIAQGLAALSAFALEGEGVTVRVNCQGPAHTDAQGLRWSGNWHSDPLPEDLVRRASEDGTTLIFWTTGPDQAGRLAEAMAERGLLEYRGRVGRSGAPWMGNWSAVRDHPLLSGLPVNTALNWEYQTSGVDGLIVEGDGVEWVAVYGKDHNRQIGTSLFTVACDKGVIIVNCLGGPYGSLTGSNPAPAAPVARRMLFNAIAYASSGKG